MPSFPSCLIWAWVIISALQKRKEKRPQKNRGLPQITQVVNGGGPWWTWVLSPGLVYFHGIGSQPQGAWPKWPEKGDRHPGRTVTTFPEPRELLVVMIRLTDWDPSGINKICSTPQKGGAQVGRVVPFRLTSFLHEHSRRISTSHPGSMGVSAGAWAGGVRVLKPNSMPPPVCHSKPWMGRVWASESRGPEFKFRLSLAG